MLIERVFMFGGGVSTLDPAEVSNIKTAKANAELFMREVVACLKAQPSHLGGGRLMSARPNLFEEEDDLDLSAFTPRTCLR